MITTTDAIKLFGVALGTNEEFRKLVHDNIAHAFYSATPEANEKDYIIMNRWEMYHTAMKGAHDFIEAFTIKAQGDESRAETESTEEDS